MRFRVWRDPLMSGDWFPRIGRQHEDHLGVKGAKNPGLAWARASRGLWEHSAMLFEEVIAV
jgi:hypothetical protein